MEKKQKMKEKKKKKRERKESVRRDREIERRDPLTYAMMLLPIWPHLCHVAVMP